MDKTCCGKKLKVLKADTGLRGYIVYTLICDECKTKYALVEERKDDKPYPIG